MAEYPEKITFELDEILGLMPWQTGPIAHALRQDGEYIPEKCEREQAHVMHWMIGLYLEYGAEWRNKVSERLQRISDEAADCIGRAATHVR